MPRFKLSKIHHFYSQLPREFIQQSGDYKLTVLSLQMMDQHLTSRPLQRKLRQGASNGVEVEAGFIIKSRFFNRKSTFFNKKSGFLH